MATNPTHHIHASGIARFLVLLVVTRTRNLMKKEQETDNTRRVYFVMSVGEESGIGRRQYPTGV